MPTCRQAVGQPHKLALEAACNLLSAPLCSCRHGILQRGTVIMDGVPGVTQARLCGGSWLARFHVGAAATAMPSCLRPTWVGLQAPQKFVHGCLPPCAQVALKPFSTQIYNFIASMPGSFWYHSHFKTQYIDGESSKAQSCLSQHSCCHTAVTQLARTSRLHPLCVSHRACRGYSASLQTNLSMQA